MSSRPPTIVAAIRAHAASHPDSPAYAFLDDAGAERQRIRYAELDAMAAALAARLAKHSSVGDRILLVFPPGLEFMVAFYGCQYAGLVPVPTIMPWRNRLRESTESIISDCRPTLALTTTQGLDSVTEALNSVERSQRVDPMGVDLEDLAQADEAQRLDPEPEDLAFLQYTSGSTSAPKGVMVSHGNLCANAEMISVNDDLWRSATRVGWIPLYHDMGLIFNAVQAAYVGALCVLMAPIAFVRRPLSWLRAISDYRAEMAIAPNFSYDSCVRSYRAKDMEGVDLSCWKLALNGAEPVHVDTLERFAETFAPHGLLPSAPHPTYGMAEATLMISGGRRTTPPKIWEVCADKLLEDYAVSRPAARKTQRLAGCGKELVNERIAIVDPLTMRRLHTGQLGEIWVSGTNIAQGYWENPEATKEIFQAEIVGEEGVPWLRTGDKGCLDAEGELYINGRFKDILIIRGANYYPQDLERTAEHSNQALRQGHSSAFVFRSGGEAKLAIVCEVERRQVSTIDVEEVVGDVRQAIVQEQELTVHSVVLAKPRAIPMTTSGKIRRQATKELWEKGELDVLDEFAGASAFVDREQEPSSSGA